MLVEPEQKKKKEIKNYFRTYRNDVSEKIKEGNYSLADMAIAETRKSKENNSLTTLPKEIKEKRIWPFIVLGAILVLGIITLIMFYFSKKDVLKLPEDASYVKNIVLSVDGFENLYIQKEISKKTFTNLFWEKIKELPVKYVSGIIVISPKETENNDGVYKNLNTSSFLNIFETSIPSSLKRNLSSQFLIGAYLPEKEPFIVFQLLKNNYSIAFKGMMEWEKTLIRDFGELLSSEVYKKGEPQISNNKENQIYTFEDKVIKNRDVRILKDNLGKIIFVYSIIKEKSIVISGGEKSFENVVELILK